MSPEQHAARAMRALDLPTAEATQALDARLVAKWLAYRALVADERDVPVTVSPSTARQLAGWLTLLAPALEDGRVDLP
jgi:hypothetical protein